MAVKALQHTGMHIMDKEMSNMDMSNMDMDMPDHGGMKMCNMKMILNADTENICILTDKWMVETKFQLVLSLLVLVVATAFYEFVKRWSTSIEQRYISLNSGIAGVATENELRQLKIKSCLAYGLSVFYSFMIMLLFMSFNWWIMGSVVLGAIIGKFFFSLNSNGKSVDSLACH
ncbi:unnamed protein product [Ambrosiozyma monospora]|uniref:Copper transport protein n=1 Tax=Ambrosiozyma monospora TaxID=43982 RepID=A0A9W6YVL2_AMBMO|nr:unnamed protein product [Ambrosiozyma monospora]